MYYASVSAGVWRIFMFDVLDPVFIDAEGSLVLLKYYCRRTRDWFQPSGPGPGWAGLKKAGDMRG